MSDRLQVDDVQVNEAEQFEGKQISFWEKVRRFFKSQQGWLFVLPAVVLMCIFTFYPIVNAFILSFKEHYNALIDIGGQTKFTWGFANFKAIITGEGIATGGADFLQCLINTLLFTLISVPLSTFLALFISVALNSIKPLQKAFQTVYFLPYLTNSLAMGAVFLTFFKTIGTPRHVETYGLVNNILGLFGVAPENYIDWIGSKSPHFSIGRIDIYWAKYIVLMAYEVWSGLPFKILILFSALQSVNKQYYDAAKVDGASRWRTLTKVTAPLISPMISYLIITGIMGGMKQYTAVVGIFGTDMGGDYKMGTMVGYIYKCLEDGHTGYAFAGSLILFAIIMVITVINLQSSKKRVHY